MVQVHKFCHQQTKKWSGGSTTQLYIFPKNSSIDNKDFEFRISTATVDVNESNFTQFPNYQRLLMILEGEMKIMHENHYVKDLKQLDVDVFDGSWNTRSQGRVRDFNIIYKHHLKVEVHIVESNQLEIKKQGDFHFLFLLEDLNTEKLSFSQFDLIEVVENFNINTNKKIKVLDIILTKK